MRKHNLVFFLVLLLGCAETPFTGTKRLILTSEAEEAKLGNEAYRQTLAKTPISKRGDWTRLVVRIGEQISRVASKPDFRWEFQLLESKEANAFCLPGGKVAVYTGMMKFFANEAQLAAVMGHEVAHATARHGGQRITLQLGTQLGFSALMAFLGGDEMTTEKKILMGALGLGAQVGAILPFGRSHETEADYIGVQYMAMAGYDPNEAVKFWQNFGKDHVGPPEWLSTHPAPQTRVGDLQAKLPEALKRYSASKKYGTGSPIPK